MKTWFCPDLPDDAPDDRDDPNSTTAYRVGCAYFDALVDGNLAGCRAIRSQWAGWPGVIRYLDEVLDDAVDWGIEDLG